jgi:regulator of ribosome biosynthesis
MQPSSSLQHQTAPPKMSDTEMDGGVALNGASPTHSALAERINNGAMDVKSPNMNGAASIADSTISSRL